VTTNMRNDIEQAACEVGRALAKYEMLVANSGYAVTQKVEFVTDQKTGKLAKQLGAKTRKVADAPKAPKAPVVARGVKKERGPRTKGVKEAISKLIASGPMTVESIINETGFKATSVRATLMGLKTTGVATQDANKLWSATFTSGSRNSETEHAGAEY
jgi:predicted Rossmann fold nucleotide-binding protein DprA/Smf involved in DNA uptake